jgi:hypothetical protein
MKRLNQEKIDECHTKEQLAIAGADPASLFM